MTDRMIPWDVHYAQEMIAKHRSAIEYLEKEIAKAKHLGDISIPVVLAARAANHEGEVMKWELELRRARGW